MRPVLVVLILVVLASPSLIAQGPPSGDMTQQAVDGRGYAVSPGAPTDPAPAPATPITAGTDRVTRAQPASSALQLTPRSDNITSCCVTGAYGFIKFNAPSPFTSMGVLMQATSTSVPDVAAKTGTSDATSSFSVFNASDSLLLRVVSNGNIGVGGATPSVWDPVLSPTIEYIDSSISFGDDTDINITSNAHYANPWKYKTTDYAANYYIYRGEHHWRVAPPGTVGATVPWTHAMSITNSGNVGIGTTAPGFKLEVVGNVHFTGTVTGGNIQARYQDVAEWVPAKEDLVPGTVVVLNPERNNEVMASGRPYDTSVAGVVSAQPGLLLGEPGQSKEQIATTGRVMVRVDATAVPIRVGDLLVTGKKPGTAMKSEPILLGEHKIHQPGTIIGKALEPLASGEAEILVLLSLQ